MYIESSFLAIIARVGGTESANIFIFVATAVLLHPIDRDLAIHTLIRR